MSNLHDLFDVALLPFLLLTAQRLVESVLFGVAAVVSLVSRDPSRRAEARRLMRYLRNRPADEP
jgi:hypothetical protein